ncbi:MAG TPA: phosphoribosylformylglycinamidine synthase I [Candidatus Omnitrophota bacterium]|nr:phosphoribosylformylglycinamidine synthase I [Candidatus Omnitrophota bacterium]
MAKKVRAIILRTAGTNCDQETAFAFRDSGADVELVHVNYLFQKVKRLDDYHILAIAGGFSYGDDISAGRILANELRLKLGQDIARFIKDGKLIIGICNGFQVLVKAGILPGSQGPDLKREEFVQQATLTTNDSGKFEDRWTYLKVSGRCAWTTGMEGIVYFPVAHGEGKFVCQNKRILRGIQDNDQVVFRYCAQDGRKTDYPGNPNGSCDEIAGITDATGHILGLMPHPERHFLFTQHPFWTRLAKKSRYGDGARVFQNGVTYIKKHC